ncbi:DUF6216 family protein [Pseudomonas sp. Kh13]|uniref:DUF6216 family protein n=1 Tax=Pseudomonas sp. Kh13 TaxID=2093744 RepID=UPI00118332D7|nr:DUF6216 family protein [Pseudomonas sp. Kh13]
MENNYLTSISALFEKIPVALTTIAIIYFFWMMIKTESSFILKHRVLELFGGKREFSDPKINAIVNRHVELHYFNWHLSLNIKSTRQMYRLVAWAKRHNLDLELLTKARPYFDVNTLKVKLWRRRTRNILTNLFRCYFILSLCAALCLFIYPGVPLKVNKTGTWFIARQDKAFSPTFEWELDRGRCLLDLTPAPLKSAWDKEVICKLILNDSSDYLSKAQKNSHKLTIIIAITSTILALLTIFIVGKAAHAESIQTAITRRLEKRNRGRLP